ncbi:hypothetical protein AB4Z18_08570 [Leifsonia sp. 2TAF2]|uniref:hypothetical protein n=1 Tax=Leifsonia sp. 2TAF2 TaxID=3233009 RepID=UPI003F9AC582
MLDRCRCLLGAAPASGDTAADDPLAAVQQATPQTANNAAQIATRATGQEAIDVTVAGVDVALPVRAADGITLGAESDSISISLPFAVSSDPATVEKRGIVSYDNNNGSTTVPVVTNDGVVQINTVITQSSGPTRYDYELSIPDGGEIVAANCGFVVVDADGDPLANVAPPWAKDAEGNPVPTRYELNGNTLTQVVDFDAHTAFPVVADPAVTWLWWGRTIKYTKNETKQIASFASDGAAVSFACAIAGPAAGLMCGAVIAIGLRIVATAARNASKAGRCIQLNIPHVGPGLIYDVKC